MYRERNNPGTGAEDIQTTKSYVNRVIKKPNDVVDNTFVQMMKALGYDIELTYVKRETYEIEQRSVWRGF